MVDVYSNANVNNTTNSNNNNINTIKTINNNESHSRPMSKYTGAIPKNTLSSHKTEKIQTGMDRYVTYTKRKSSPRTSKLEPNPKQAKTNSVSQNRFALLDNQESEKIPSMPLKDCKPPPLYLHEPTTNLLGYKLSQLGKENFHVVSLRKGNIQETKIQTYSEKSFRTIVDNFDSEKRNYYTYQLKSAKGLTVVIKGYRQLCTN
ncbi:ankyrin repeat-containing protein kinase A-like [Lucilia sericata]|uniref:ankyrin repeat-containing protein kinase A-like n=1 Tax=Lucilia sericata TaxID=13632 RepID=UPI0018A7EC0F|nr:ankyrin repeat-containing protein kinase A-like [Lucilia sericata]